MFGLPTSTFINRQLSKERVFKEFKVNSAAQDLFNADIATMFITNHVSDATVPGLKPGKIVKGFYVLTLNLKHESCEKKNLELLAKAIPQNLIFALVYENTVRFAVSFENLFVSNPVSASDARLPLRGSDLDEAWETVVKAIGKIEIENGNTLKEQIAQNKTREELAQKIKDLTEKAYKEKQPRRKMELIEEVKNLQRQLENL